MSFSAMVKEELFDQMAKPKAGRIGKKRVLLREAFMESGSVSDPLSSYHLEFAEKTAKRAQEICAIIESFGLKPGIVERKGRHVVYLKEADQISTMLGLMDAQKAVMEFENSRILRGISGNINRQVNCETANISKAVRAGVRQLDGIRLIRDTIGLEKLPAPLQPVAAARLENPEMPLKELGEMMDPPLGKSGIYHRLKKIGDIAERIKEEKSWTTS